MQDNYTLQLLNIQDEHITITKVETINNIIHVNVSFDSVPSNFHCPNCDSVSFHKHGYYNRTISHINVGKQKSIIHLKQPRFICIDCGKTFNAPTSLVDHNRRLSTNLIESIITACSTKISFKDAAINNFVSETLISDEFQKQINEYRCELTEVVCIDEFKASTIAGKYALIIGDPLTGTILDILPARTQDYLLYYFQTIKKEEILKVKYIVTDLFEPYRSIIHSCFPRVIHIADRFHWIRQAAEAFNKQRINIMNHYLAKAKYENNAEKIKHIQYANLLKRNYKLLLSNKYGHEEWYYDQIVKKGRFGEQITMNDLIEECINGDENLEEAYHLLQELYQIAKYSNINNARDNLTKWIEKVKESNYDITELKKTALTYKSWLTEIINSYILNPKTHERMSNGFIEGKNNFCKTIKRIGFGYKNFDLFRNRIININKNIK